MRKSLLLIIIIIVSFALLALYLILKTSDKSIKERPAIVSNSTWTLENIIDKQERNNFALADSFNDKAVPTNNWYLPLEFSTNKDPIYVIPYSINIDGNSINYANTAKNITPNLIHKPHIPDFGIVIDGLVKKELDLKGDFSVKENLLDSDNQIIATLTLTKSSPLSFYDLRTNHIILNSFKDSFKNTKINDNTYLIDFGLNKYLLYSKNLKDISSGTSTTLDISFNNNQATFVIAVLPSEASIDGYLQVIDNKIIDTKVEFSVNSQSNSLQTTYTVVTDNGKPTIVGLIPSIYRNLVRNNTQELDYSFDTLRGKLNLIITNSFETSLKIPRIEDEFNQNLSDSELKELNAYVVEDGNNSKFLNEGTYSSGKDLFRISNILKSAELIGEETTKSKLLELIKNELANWFTYNGEETSKFFKFDQSMGGVIGEKTEFGSESFNDHHFHYGYFIYAFSTVCELDSSFCNEYKGMVDLLIKDIASTDRSEYSFPYIRGFDLYEGHSWAGGTTTFADGNNQESVSEAINTWYAIYKYGKIINDEKIRNLGLSLYTQEVEASKTYWLNYYQDESIFAKKYEPNYASLVWGGKIEPATFFNSTKEASLGIIVLPVTGASVYLYNPEVAQKLVDRLPTTYTIFDDIINQYKMINDIPFNKLDNWAIDPINSKSHSYLLQKLYKDI